MYFSFLNLAMLLGLAAVAIPPLIHLLNRRRYTVVDWGAMQFLLISDARRRRLLIEELLLMALRMGLIAVLVLALAAPVAVGSLFSWLGGQRNRDVVLVFGGSAGMDAHGSHQAAKEWALKFLGQLAPEDRVVILQAKKQVVPVLAEPTSDFDLVRRAIEELPPPGGGCDWPRAVQEAQRILEKSQRPLRNIILLGDGQRHGWSDENTLGYWQALASQAPPETALRPGIWYLNFDPGRAAAPPNWALSPIRAKRVTAYVKQEIEFQTDLLLFGQTRYEPPEWVRLETDGNPAGRRDLPFPEKLAGQQPAKAQPTGSAGKKQDVLVVPLPPFKHTFLKPGSHLVSVIAKPKGAKEVRQDFAVEILRLPVLIVDGDPPPPAGAEPRTKFLRVALDPRSDDTKEPPTAMLAHVVSLDKFDPELLNRDLDKTRPGSKPCVLVLANVHRLTATQQAGVTRFLRAGGGVLVTLGDRVESTVKHYNDDLYRKGEGWLPARLEKPVKPGLRRAASPLPPSFAHQALEFVRESFPDQLSATFFPCWWRVNLSEEKGKAVTIGRLTSKDPFLVEGNYQGGRVLLCSVPLTHSQEVSDEKSWDTNMIGQAVFAPFLHELVYYLAGNFAAGEGNLHVRHNLAPGQPLHYRPGENEPKDRLTLSRPGGKAKPLAFEGPHRLEVHLAQVRGKGAGQGTALASRPQIVYEGTQHAGAYVLQTPRPDDWLAPEFARFFNGVLTAQRKVYYTVRTDDPGEYDLTPSTAEERAEVARQIPLNYETDGDKLLRTLADQAHTQELWWWFLVAVVGLLCCEVWMTRRIVRAR
jgi:hypothetical protein